jgi:hypothetical protein
MHKYNAIHNISRSYWCTIDISKEDLVDLYEFAVERALSQKTVSKK